MIRTQESKIWQLPEALPLKQLSAELQNQFTVASDPETSNAVVFMDSFDWCLYQKGYLLRCVNKDWELLDRQTGARIALSQGPLVKQQACFANVLPAGKLHDSIAPLLDIRCLLPLFTVQQASQHLRVLNKDRKTVGRITLTSQQVENSDLEMETVELRTVRGYDNKARELEQALMEKTGQEPTVLVALFEQALQTQGRAPLDYSSKFSITLDPDEAARFALIDIYEQLIAAMRVNIPGVISDYDSEFLHDFRVAIRRTRSALSLIKKVLPPELVNEYKEKFAQLGSITGPTRDLDVYLLYEEEYKSKIPEFLREGLHAFFEDLAAQRVVEQRKLVKALKSGVAEQIIDSWEEALQDEDMALSPMAEIPIIDLAQDVIFRRYKRVMADGLAINDASPDEELHRLRIQGKKLRYAIEFFSSLFPKKQIDAVLKQLKQLQNNLGDFNDLSVQQDVLKEYQLNLRPGSRKNLELGTALGALMSKLYEEHQEVRKAFAATFTQFGSEKNVALFRSLFRADKEAK